MDEAKKATRRATEAARTVFAEWVEKALVDSAKAAHRYTAPTQKLLPPLQTVKYQGKWAVTPVDVMHWREAKWQGTWATPDPRVFKEKLSMLREKAHKGL